MCAVGIRYWERTLADKVKALWEYVIRSESVINHVRGFIAERGYRTIFVPANGISCLPLGLAHLGYAVTAQDISPFACNYVAGREGDAEILGRLFTEREDVTENGHTFLSHNAAKSALRVAKEYCPGGTMTLTSGDVYAYEPDAPFDVIFDVRFAQTQGTKRRGELAALYLKWLKPGGLVILSTINVGCYGQQEGLVGGFRKPFADAGYAMTDEGWEALSAHLDAGEEGVLHYNAG